MYCKNCGTQLADGTNFCPNCGTSIAEKNTQEQESMHMESVKEIKSKNINQFLKQLVFSGNSFYYGLPILFNGILGLILGMFGYFNIYYGAMGDASGVVLRSFSKHSESARKEYLAYMAYKEAAGNMDLLIKIGITLIIIGIITLIIVGLIKPKKINILRMLLWVIPLIIVLLIAGKLYVPCLSYISNYQ